MRLLSARRPTQARDGASAERRAEAHLQRHGLLTVTRNFRTRRGEIDLVMRDGETLVFVEVRLRRNGRFGGAAESITAAKQRRVLIAAQWWLGGAGRRFRDAPCRFDAVLLDALDPARVTWLPGAFDAG